MKTIPVVLLTFFFILAFDSRSSAASVSGKVVEIHYGAGTASPADQVIVTFYRMNNYLDRPDGPKLGSFITKIDGLSFREYSEGRIHAPCARRQVLGTGTGAGTGSTHIDSQRRRGSRT